MLTEVMKRIDDMKYMRGHRVHPSKSPLLAKNKIDSFKSINPSVYYEYPQPWFAAISDICHYIEKLRL
jgi:hypothetical protein